MVWGVLLFHFSLSPENVVTFQNMELPNLGEDDFDKDITNGSDDKSLGEEPSFLPMVLMFMEMYESFTAMLAAGFTEAQALRFHAYCAISDGDG